MRIDILLYRLSLHKSLPQAQHSMLRSGVGCGWMVV